MKRVTLLLLIVSMTNMIYTMARTMPQVTFERVQGFPDGEEGIATGVSACFAGAIGDTLVMAGGCNFPETPAAYGGKKRYYRGIYTAVIDGKNQLDWRLAGWLPEAVAYGVSVPTRDGLICIGGCNDTGSMRSVWLIRLQGGKAVVSELPSLPHAMDNFTGAGKGSRMMVSDGEHLYQYDLEGESRSWTEVAQVGNSKLAQPVSAFVGDAFCLWGGVTPKTAEQDATLQLGGWQYDGVKSALAGPVDEHGDPIYLGGAAAVNLSPTAVLAVGGVNKDVFLSAVNHPQPDYMTHPAAWYRFNPYICLYEDGAWQVIGRSDVTARAGAALVRYEDRIYLIGGELKPGIRTAKIYSISF